jgi:hypothetical protein
MRENKVIIYWILQEREKLVQCIYGKNEGIRLWWLEIGKGMEAEQSKVSTTHVHMKCNFVLYRK